MISLFSCTHDSEVTPYPNPDPVVCDSAIVTYNGTIIPILDANCFSCHSGQTPEGGLDLSNYDQLAFVAQNGSLLGSIRHEPGYSAMPKGLPKLSDCDIALIAKWVNDTTFTNPVEVVKM